jgi:hypothetical protein
LCYDMTPAFFRGGGGSIITLLEETTHYWHWLLSYMWHHWVWSVLLKARIHKGQLERLFHWLNSFLHSSAAHVTGSYAFFTVSSLFSQSKTQIMTDPSWSIDAKELMISFCIIVNIPKIGYLASLVMQDVNKRILFMFFGLHTLFVEIILSDTHHTKGQ